MKLSTTAVFYIALESTFLVISISVDFGKPFLGKNCMSNLDETKIFSTE